MELLWGVFTASYLVTTVRAACSDCAYRGCHKVDNSKLNIHLIAHTHDDAGWLKTVDQYYYGGTQNQAAGGVQYIIDSVIGELDADENRRFILAETGFLWRWWNDRGEHVRHKMRKFLESGRLQLVAGGWVMSDEATPHYTMLIDHMSLGIRFLKDIFGDCGIPKIAWQIDPFGHSSEQGEQFAKMGFDAVFFGRINQDEYLTRRDKREMEMIWRPYKDGSTIFTGVLYNLYQPPDGLCFDVSCHDEPIMDNPRLHGYNMERRIASFVNSARTWADAYQTNHVQLTMGGDFHYMVASSWFVNLDKIIKHVNERYPDLNVIYSTPACYLKAINDLNTTWPAKENEDFFPYCSYERKFWTGYYTSRANLKYYIARANNILQVIKKVGAYSNTWNSFDEFEVERAVALAQHHDAIAGTQRQHVANDYALYLHEAVHRSKDMLTKAYRSWGEVIESRHSFCMLRNISECHITQRNRKFVLYVFNPLPTETNFTIRIPYHHPIQAYESSNLMVYGDIMPVPPSVMAIPGRHSLAKSEYVFQANGIPAMGFKSFYVQHQNPTGSPTADQTSDDYYNPELPELPTTELTLGFDSGIQIVINTTTGLLQYVIMDEATWYLEQSFGYYEGTNRWTSSGAYTFSPSQRGLIRLPKNPTYTVHRGQNVIEVHQVFESWVSQVIRLYRGQQSIEFEWLVGPINLHDTAAKEVITIYKTHLVTNGIFYTDSNGRKFMKRRRDYRGKQRNHSPRIESNYYPVTTAARIHDDRATLTVLTDRAQGASSNVDGSLEFMLQRRLLVDDNKGVTEPLDEKSFGVGIVTRGIHIVQFTTNSDAAYLHRTRSLAITQGPLLSISPTSRTINQWQPASTSFLKGPVPENINVMTLQKLSPTTVLLRLEHIYDVDEDPQYSVPTEVNISALFSRRVKSVKEVTLDGNSDRDCELGRLVWSFAGNTTRTDKRTDLVPPLVVLEPMEIRTFVVYYFP
uniref:Alpha-mannosidase n=1 Tax=Lygus hesperus TaxID=30085 RepID=A0A0K8SVP2_LYGHE